MTVNLKNVTSVQNVTITLFGVNDGTNTDDVGVRVGFLIGDVTADRFANSFDVTQAESGKPVNDNPGTSNFRKDVTADGFINSFDVTTVKSKSGTGLPP